MSLSVPCPILRIKVRAGMHILDVGCGVEADCFAAVNQVGAGGFVYGIDLLEEMIQLERGTKSGETQRDSDYWRRLYISVDKL